MQAVTNFIKRLLQKTGIEIVKGKRQLWWIDNKTGGYDGYELQPGGKLFLLNWDLFTGIRWEMTNQGLYTEMMYKKNGNVLKKTAAILSLTDTEMVLKTTTPDNEFIDTYIKITYGTIADAYYGHYTNTHGYAQIIPVHEYQFQVVFSEYKEHDVVKYYGDFDKKTQTLKFRMEGKEIVLKHQTVGDTEVLTVDGKKYYRPVLEG